MPLSFYLLMQCPVCKEEQGKIPTNKDGHLKVTHRVCGVCAVPFLKNFGLDDKEIKTILQKKEEYEGLHERPSR